MNALRLPIVLSMCLSCRAVDAIVLRTTDDVEKSLTLKRDCIKCGVDALQIGMVYAVLSDAGIKWESHRGAPLVWLNEAVGAAPHATKEG